MSDSRNLDAIAYFVSKYPDLTSWTSPRGTTTIDNGPSGRLNREKGFAVLEHNGCTVGIAGGCETALYASDLNCYHPYK